MIQYLLLCSKFETCISEQQMHEGVLCLVRYKDWILTWALAMQIHVHA